MKGEEGGFQKCYIRFSHDCGFKIQKYLFTSSKDVRFNFTHFASFKFTYLETEVSFGLIWVNLQNDRFHLQISILGTWKVLVSSIGFVFAHFVYKENFGQIWIKITDWYIRDTVTCFTNYGVPFWI